MGALPISPFTLTWLWKNLNTLTQLLTCSLSQPSFMQGSRSSKHSTLSLTYLVHPLDEVLQLLSVDAVLEPRPPAGLRIPGPSVRPYRLPPIPRPQLLQEQVGVGYALRVVAYPECEEGPEAGLERDPQPGLPALDLDHGLVDEDRRHEPPVDVEPVADRGQPLDPLPDGLVAPLHHGLKNP